MVEQSETQVGEQAGIRVDGQAMSPASSETGGQDLSATDSTVGGQVGSAVGGQDLRNSRFTAVWVIVILLGIAVEFFGRLFGYENNPTPVYHTWMPLLTATLSVIVGLVGYFTFTSGTAKQSTLRRRNGALILAMAAIMLITSFAFKPVIPLIFG